MRSPLALSRLSLARQIFAGTAMVVAVTLGATLLITSRSARANADATLSRALAQTNARVVDQLSARRRELEGALGVFAQNRSVVAVIVNDTSGADALDQARQAADQTGAAWVQVIDSLGVRRAKSDEPAAERVDLSTSPLVRRALGGEGASGFGVGGDSALLLLVATPVHRDLAHSGSVAAVLLAADRIRDTLATAIGAVTGSDVVFYALDRSGHPRVTGASRGITDRSHVQEVIAARLMGGPEDGVRPAGGGRTPSMLGRASALTELTMDGAASVGQNTPLLSAAGGTVGGVLVLRSRDAELAGYYALRRTLLGAGAAGLLLAVALSGTVARRLTRPVAALVTAARRAAEGDYATEITTSSGGEIGTLAEAIRQLLADLRDKQALVEFLGGGAMVAAAPAPADAATVLVARATGEGVSVGRRLASRYDIQAVLGEGGMGTVFRAVDRELHEVVALKTLRPEVIASDESALERFKSEIRLARRISHRNVVRTHDLGEWNGLYFITMEYVEGASLKALVQDRGRLPVPVLLPIAKQLCRALEVAHDAGVIHRDVKPQNMVVERDGTLKVMDFGIARLAERAPSAGLTQAGMVVGTPEYMAPEQLLGDDLDPRTDLYAVGVVLYECLTGRLPFEAPTPLALVARVLEETPRAPTELVSDVPPVLSELVMRAMSRDAAARPASAAALHAELDRLGGSALV